MKPETSSRLILLALFCLAITGSLSAQSTFTNAALITINDNAAATPYPSLINVSGLSGTISNVTVTLTDINHAFPDDIGVLLVSPTGTAVRLMTDAGGGLVQGFSNTTLTFDDAALTGVPDEGPVPSGSYQPTQGTQDLLSGPHPADFAAPAPMGPYNNLLSSLNGTNPNGAWSLYVDDDTAVDGGTINSGWLVTITTAAVPEPSTWILLGVGIAALATARRWA
jgi:subtilisin-like proprotein convertase family protein